MNISIRKGLVVIMAVVAVFGLLIAFSVIPFQAAFAQDAPCIPLEENTRIDYGLGHAVVGEKQDVTIWVGTNSLSPGVVSTWLTLTGSFGEAESTAIDSAFNCTSPATFEISSTSAGYTFFRVVSGGYKNIDGFGITFYSPYPDGTLISSRGFSQVFIIQDGQKWRIPTVRDMERFGLSWSDVIEVDQGNELAYDFGGTWGSYMADGALIREAGTADIWIVKIVGSKRYKRLILSPHVMNSYAHLRWDNVIDVESSVLGEFTTSDLVRADGDDRIYKLSAREDVGDRQWVRDDAFTRNGFDQDAIYTINAVDRDAYTDGADIE